MSDIDPLLATPHKANPTEGYQSSIEQEPDQRARASSDTQSPLPPSGESDEHGTHQGNFKVYKSRWFILAVFSLLAFFQSAAWNTWGPIATTAKAVLNWTNGDIALLTNWGPITYLATSYICSYLLILKGLRFCLLGTAVIVLLGLSIRCLPVGIENVKWTMNVGHIVLCMPYPVLSAACTQVSAVWFPSHQRTTSTAIALASGALGVSASFLIGPLVLSSLPKNDSHVEHLTPAMRSHYFNEIMHLMYLECGGLAIVVVAAMLYFPEQPQTAPSVSATISRESFKDGALAIIKNVNFWLSATPFTLTSGVYNGWQSQIDSIFHSTLNVDQNHVGIIGFVTQLSVVITGVILGRFVDVIGGRMKAVLIVSLIVSSLSCTWCVLLTMKYIPYTIVSLYLSNIFIGVSLGAPLSIFSEMMVEGLYPVAESQITMFLMCIYNAASLIFLLLFMIPNIGVIWMTWFLLGSVIACLLLLLLYNERYNRKEIDNPNSQQSSTPNNEIESQ